MTGHVQSFTVADARFMDGDVFDVAERSLRQCAAVAHVLRGALVGARLMARNAEMERQLLAAGECSAADFEDAAQARILDGIAADLERTEKNLAGLAKAAGYDPRHPRS